MSNSDPLTQAIALAWGWLWHITTDDDRVLTARHLLKQHLTREDMRWGIQTAKDEGARVNVHEIESAFARMEPK